MDREQAHRMAQNLGQTIYRLFGGPGSGNFGHGGRPGEVGGSEAQDAKEKSAAASKIENLIRTHGTTIPATAVFKSVDDQSEAQSAWMLKDDENSEPHDQRTEDLPVDKIIATQPDLDRSGLQSYAGRSKADPITVVRLGGKTYAVDGHHRLAVDVLKGRKTITADVYDFDSPKLRSAGGKGSGNFNHEGRPGERGGSGESAGGDRSARALAAHNPFTRKKDRIAAKNEQEITHMLGGQGTNNNQPVDVVWKSNGKVYGIEVKTMLDNKASKITMRKDALGRKIAWARSNHASLHTVIIDDRKAFGRKDLYSGHRLYYQKGVGSFRLSTMRKVESEKHLRDLLRGGRK